MRPLLLPAVALVFLAGCEGALDAPAADLSLQTRSALEVLPASADAVGMLDLRAAHESPVGRAGGPFSLEGLSGEDAARFDEFVRLTGFDPEEDLARVYVAVTGEGDDALPTFVAYGAFDRGRIDAYLQQHAPEGTALERTTIDGLPVYLGDAENGRRFGLALVNDEMALAGEEGALRAMIGRVERGGGLDTDAEMMGLVDRAAYPDDAWFAVRRLDQHAAQEGEPEMSAFANAGGQMARGVLSFDFRADGVAMQAVGFPRAGAAAGDVADFIKGGVAAMRTQAQAEPEVVGALDAVEVRTAGEAVTVEAFVPQPLFERMTRDS